MFTTNFEFLKILKTKIIKMSQTTIVNFEMMYKIEFTGTPCLQNKTKDSVRVFKKNGILIGHIPIELSQLTDYFMKKI